MISALIYHLHAKHCMEHPHLSMIRVRSGVGKQRLGYHFPPGAAEIVRVGGRSFDSLSPWQHDQRLANAATDIPPNASAGRQWLQWTQYKHGSHFRVELPDAGCRGGRNRIALRLLLYGLL